MFCVKCGNEIKDDWTVCPFCGHNVKKKDEQPVSAPMQQEPEKSNQDMHKQDMSKLDKPVKKNSDKVKKVLIGVGTVFLVFLLILIITPSGDDSDSKEDKASKVVKTMDEVGGYEAWVESKYKDTVRTDIVVTLPITEREADNYAVNIMTSFGDMIFIEQDDGAMSTEWEWLNNAEPDIEGGSSATFQATLTLSGYCEIDGEVYPVFLAEEVQSYFSSNSQETEEYTIEDYLAECTKVTLEELGRNPDVYVGKHIIVEGSLGTAMGELYIGLWSSANPIVFEYDGEAYDKNFNPIGNILNTDYGYVAGEFLEDETIKATIVVVTESEDSVGETENDVIVVTPSDGSTQTENSSEAQEDLHSYEMPDLRHDHNSYTFIGTNGRYFDFSNGSEDVALSVEISNFTENTFDFVIYEYNSVIFKHHTAEITSECSGTYYGQQYTLYFTWTDGGVLEISGFEPVEGVTFTSPDYYGAS